jgi:hypothetical protein
MNKVFFVFIILFIFCVSFGQTNPKNLKNNPNPNTAVLLSKIVKYIHEDKQDDEYGYARMGSLTGYSTFDFSSLTNNNIKLTINYQMRDYYGSLSKLYVENGALKNIQYKVDDGQFNTKVVTADWVTQNVYRQGYFKLSIPKYLNNEVLISVYNEKGKWEYSDKIKLSNNHFQDLINDLTISGSPVDFIKEREVLIKKDSLEKIQLRKLKVQNIETKLKEDSVKMAPNFENPIKIGNLLVTNTDYKMLLNRRQISIFLDKYTEGWRLPTPGELFLMKKNIETMKQEYYWCLTEDFSSFDIFNSNNKELINSISDKDEISCSLRLVKGYCDSSLLMKSIISKTIKVDNFLVASSDFPGADIQKALNFCKKYLSNGWRLPTIQELNRIYDFPKLFPDMEDYEYLSMSGNNDKHPYASDFLYDYGMENNLSKDDFLYFKDFNHQGKVLKYYLQDRSIWGDNKWNGKIRFIKSLNEINLTKEDIFELDNLIISNRIFPIKMNWFQAKYAIKLLGERWRLPTIEELKLIFDNYSTKSKFNYFIQKGVWSSTPNYINERDISFTYPSFFYYRIYKDDIFQFSSNSNEEFYFIPIRSK